MLSGLSKCNFVVSSPIRKFWPALKRGVMFEFDGPYVTEFRKNRQNREKSAVCQIFATNGNLQKRNLRYRESLLLFPTLVRTCESVEKRQSYSHVM